MTYLLFIRRLDELQTQREQKANLLKRPIEDPIYHENEYPLRWSHFKNTDPEVMHKRFTQADGVFDFLRNVGSRSAAFSKYMKGATFMIPTPRLLAQVVEMLSNIDMSDRDTKGDVYEYLLSKIASAGQNGQFRTPRHIIRLMVDMVQPSLEDVICDRPARAPARLPLPERASTSREHCANELYADGAQAHFQNHHVHGDGVRPHHDPHRGDEPDPARHRKKTRNFATRMTLSEANTPTLPNEQHLYCQHRPSKAAWTARL